MAKSAVENPRYYSGPPLLARQRVRARDGKTWKAGQPMCLDSGLWEPCASTDTNNTLFQALASSDQDTATSTSDVYIDRITSTETKLAAYMSYGDSDYTSKRSQIGTACGIHVGSNVATVDINETTNSVVRVENPEWVAEPYMNDSTDSPGKVIFTVRASAIGTS
jgi:hypothetical protein